jgi:Anti-sigma-K factor rskA
MTCAERRDAILLFAAGLLDEPEAAELRTHLASGCEACALHLAEAREVEYALAAAAPGAAAPHLRGELLRRIDRLPQQSMRTRPRATERARRSLVPLALAAGLGAAIAAPIAWWLAAERHGARFAEREAALVAELEDAREELAETEDELSDIEARERRVESDLERAHRQVAMLSEMSLVTLDLKPVRGLPKEAQARVFWEWDDYYCFLHAEGLPAQDAPSVYALWLDTEGGNRVLAGTFSVEEGQGTLWVQLPRDMGRAVHAEITLEPGQPGPQPSGALQLTSGPPRAF